MNHPNALRLAALSIAAVLAGCGNDAASSGMAAASGTARAAAASASMATARPVFAGKVTPEKVRDYKPGLAPSMTLDSAIATVAADLGPPTQSDSKRVIWAAADDKLCAAFSIEKSGAMLGAWDAPRPVESKDFGEQFGKLCLLRAGVAPARPPFSGKTYPLADFVAAADKGGAGVGTDPVRIEGLFESGREDPSANNTIVLADGKDATTKVTCKLELGAPLPALKEKDKVVLQGTPHGGVMLDECFVVPSP